MSRRICHSVGVVSEKRNLPVVDKCFKGCVPDTVSSICKPVGRNHLKKQESIRYSNFSDTIKTRKCTDVYPSSVINMSVSPIAFIPENKYVVLTNVADVEDTFIPSSFIDITNTDENMPYPLKISIPLGSQVKN